MQYFKGKGTWHPLKKLSIGKIASHVLLILVSFAIIIPLVYLVSISFSDEADIIKNGYSLIPRVFSLRAYEQAFAVPELVFQAYGVTMFVTVVGTTMSLMMTAGIAYVASRRDFKYKKLISMFLLLPLLFNGGMVSQYIINTQIFHLDNTIWALILPYGVNVWFAFMLKGFMSSIPFELIEAVKIDGASEYRTFFVIILPLSTSGLATIGLFYAFAFWNDWWLAMMYIMDTKLIPLQYMLQRIMQSIEFYTKMLPPGMNVNVLTPIEGMRMALALIAAGPMLLVFPFFQKYFVKGVAVGSVKG